jgi:hypothetical protein
VSISTGDLQALVDKTNTFFEEYGEDAWVELQNAILVLKNLRYDLLDGQSPLKFKALSKALEVLEAVKETGKYEIPRKVVA